MEKESVEKTEKVEVETGKKVPFVYVDKWTLKFKTGTVVFDVAKLINEDSKKSLENDVIGYESFMFGIEHKLRNKFANLKKQLGRDLTVTDREKLSQECFEHLLKGNWNQKGSGSTKIETAILGERNRLIGIINKQEENGEITKKEAVKMRFIIQNTVKM